MDKTLAAALATIVVGGLIALQAPINSGLGRATGTLPAAAISFSVGTILLIGIVLVSGQASQVSGAADVRLHYLIGGLLGAAYVTTVLLTVRTLGAGGVTAATVAGQLTTVGDHRPARASSVSRSSRSRSGASRECCCCSPARCW